MAETKRQRHDRLRAQLDNEVTTFIPHWRDLGDYILPRRTRFSVCDVNKGDRRTKEIKDSTGTLAARTGRAGMMGGVTSPARPWFALAAPDPLMNEIPGVKEWLHTVSQRMATVFLKSNIYNTLPLVYGDIFVFGTSAMMIEEDFDDVLRSYSFPIGSYRISNNHKMKVDVFTRDFQMTVRQIVERFGKKKDSGSADWSNLSSYVKTAWDKGDYETWIQVAHIIQPNEQYDTKSVLGRYKKFASCYYESGQGGPMGQAAQDYRNGVGEQYLSESGYDYFPVLCPRWETTGEDVYATECPGMISLPDIKQLQKGEVRIMQAIEKMVNPPMVGSSYLQNRASSIVAGGITYEDVRDGGRGFRPAHEVNPRVQDLEFKQDQVRGRIKRAFYEDLFLMLAMSDRREITAREIEERHEEKLLALGPVLEQLNQDLLDPAIDITFDFMLKRSLDARGNFIEGGLIPKPPEVLAGVPLRVDYISVMHQAQKLVSLGGLERFAGFVGEIAQVDPSVLDKVNGDELVDAYGEATSMRPKIVRTDDEAAQIREQRAKQAQVQKAAEQAQALSQTAKNLGQTDMSGENALTRLMDTSQAGQLVPN